MEEGGKWGNEVWAGRVSYRRIKFHLQGAGAHPWILERRSGLARGSYSRLVADGRFLSKQSVSEVQWCLNTCIPGGGFSAF